MPHTVRFYGSQIPTDVNMQEQDQIAHAPGNPDLPEKIRVSATPGAGRAQAIIE